jgi:hypothetical protein
MKFKGKHFIIEGVAGSSVLSLNPQYGASTHNLDVYVGFKHYVHILTGRKEKYQRPVCPCT